MPAHNVPAALSIPAMARDLGPILDKPRSLRYGERHDMLIEANRAARRQIPINGQIIHPLAVSVLMELDDHYNMQEGISRPSRERIAANLGIADVAAISRAISELVRAGFVIREQRGRRTIYRFRGPLYAHHLRADAGQDEDVDNLQESAPGDTYVAGTSVADDTGHSVNSVADDTPIVLPVTPPYKNPVLEPAGVTKNPEPTHPSGAPVGAARKTRLSRDFELTDERRAYGVAQGIPEATVAEVFEDFCLYWWGSGGTKLDWGLTWMTWARREGAKHKQRGRGAGGWTGQRRGPSNLGPTAEQMADPNHYDDYDQKRRER